MSVSPVHSFTDPFSNPFANPDYRALYCKPNSLKINGDTFWSTLREQHQSHPPQEWPEWGIRFKRFVVVRLEEINIANQFARVFVTESDHLSALEHSFSVRGWDVGQPLVCVGNTKQIQQVCSPSLGLRNITETYIGVVGKHRITTMRRLMQSVWTSAATDPHDWRTVFTHVLVAVFEYDSPTAMYVHDLLTNTHGLPAKSTSRKDVENALRHLTDHGCLTSETREGLAQIESLIETVSPHLRERERTDIKQQHRTTVVTKRGESIRPISGDQKRLDQVKARIFDPWGVPKEKRYLTEDGRLTRPFSKGLVSWVREYEETGNTSPVVVAGYLPLNKTTERTNTSLAETRRGMQRVVSSELTDQIMTFVQLMEYFQSKVPQGQSWVSLNRDEQCALVAKWYPVKFVDFVAQNDAPDPTEHGAKREPEHTLVTTNGKRSGSLSRWGYQPVVQTEDVDVITRIFSTPVETDSWEMDEATVTTRSLV